MPRPETRPTPSPSLPLLAWLATLSVLCPAWPRASTAAAPAVAEEVAFVRLVRDDAGAPLSLDTSIVR
ncbi:hypothetical protein EBR56_11145, partial [bacterium]|nr:hypothetical protein [bacterium]